MKSYADKSKQTKSQSVANALSTDQQVTTTPYQLKDNRPQTVVQQKQDVVQLKKYYRWTQNGTVIECSQKSYKRSKRKATEAEYFEHNPAMQAEMEPKVSRTYETARDVAANAGAPARRQRSQSIHVPTRNRSGSFDIRHTHDNINSAAAAVDRSVGHIDRDGVRTGEPARVGSRASSADEITKPEE